MAEIMIFSNSILCGRHSYRHKKSHFLFWFEVVSLQSKLRSLACQSLACASCKACHHAKTLSRVHCMDIWSCQVVPSKSSTMRLQHEILLSSQAHTTANNKTHQSWRLVCRLSRASMLNTTSAHLMRGPCHPKPKTARNPKPAPQWPRPA